MKSLLFGGILIGMNAHAAEPWIIDSPIFGAADGSANFGGSRSANSVIVTTGGTITGPACGGSTAGDSAVSGNSVILSNNVTIGGVVSNNTPNVFGIGGSA